ncbi:hypothetical protein CLERM_494 [Coxiella-like endosymbiont]|nr:hypothetical protein CLERM_494 [Coxiella-like endosymbiont]
MVLGREGQRVIKTLSKNLMIFYKKLLVVIKQSLIILG